MLLAAHIRIRFSDDRKTKTLEELITEIPTSLVLNDWQKGNYQSLSTLIEIHSREERLRLFLFVYLSQMLPVARARDTLLKQVNWLLEQEQIKAGKDSEGNRYNAEKIEEELEKLQKKDEKTKIAVLCKSARRKT